MIALGEDGIAAYRPYSCRTRNTGLGIQAGHLGFLVELTLDGFLERSAAANCA